MLIQWITSSPPPPLKTWRLFCLFRCRFSSRLGGEEASNVGALQPAGHRCEEASTRPCGLAAGHNQVVMEDKKRGALQSIFFTTKCVTQSVEKHIEVCVVYFSISVYAHFIWRYNLNFLKQHTVPEGVTFGHLRQNLGDDGCSVTSSACLLWGSKLLYDVHPARLQGHSASSIFNFESYSQSISHGSDGLISFFAFHMVVIDRGSFGPITERSNSLSLPYTKQYDTRFQLQCRRSKNQATCQLQTNIIKLFGWICCGAA
ncbi:uncharacterized protein LOC119304235 [Triticum dicoccoides]|uniref:uncharacterized protein LOC119304235 n=1 Tax=Triticum dicoccoides TaxID=85692 RepID=UPI00188F1BDA|nr:uncharacterized protein LOC119304235 [Triticum dicoccoides]